MTRRFRGNTNHRISQALGAIRIVLALIATHPATKLGTLATTLPRRLRMGLLFALLPRNFRRRVEKPLQTPHDAVARIPHRLSVSTAIEASNAKAFGDEGPCPAAVSDQNGRCSSTKLAPNVEPLYIESTDGSTVSRNRAKDRTLGRGLPPYARRFYRARHTLPF
jgi:hypothetical protein